ncbi:hypothetical protein KSF73_06265 [Burkholderiaceae bacterium DAT-1]|nr:hypothetical protein [Burkholderiaceae bacterium DAT-1]
MIRRLAACIGVLFMSHTAMAACQPNPLGSETLYLRGSMNGWAPQDDFAFTYVCDAFFLNIDLQGKHSFKVADEAWQDATTWGVAGNAAVALDAVKQVKLASGREAVGNGDLSATFSGKYTLRLSFRDGTVMLEMGPQTWVAPKAPPISNPVAKSLRHDSRALANKSPFGAVVKGTSVHFALNARKGVQAATLVIQQRRITGNQDTVKYLDFARVPMQASADGRSWQADFRFDQHDTYGYYFEVQIAGKTYLYQNNNDPIPHTRERGSNGLGEVAWMPERASSIRRFRQSVYLPDFKVPDYAADMVYYYIFPDRFRNGDRSNDPRPGVDRFMGEHTVELHQNWHDKPSKPGTGDGSDDVYSNDFFGGDLAGIIEKLDYLRDLGVNALYINPMFQADSNHKYDTGDYRTIDPHFGSNEDFVRLCTEAAKRGIRVIPDTSLNHTGTNSRYFDRYGQYGGQGAFANGKPNPASPYYDWYTFDTTQIEPDKQYKGWFGLSSLPELNKNSPSYREFAFSGPDSITKLWLDRGAAGWRMDVVPYVQDDFWREWRKAVKAVKPDAITVAETWFDSSKYLLGDTFDSSMNYVFRNAVLDIAHGEPVAQTYRALEYLREVYPPQALYAMMNLLSSHDVERSLWVLGYEDDSSSAARIAEAKARFRLSTLLQMTYPGAPTIYYGDEVGVTGGPDPYNRATYPWADLGGKPDETLLADIRRYTHLRNDLPILRHGSLEAPVFADKHSLVLRRTLNQQTAYIAINNSTQPQTVSFKAREANARFKDALNGGEVKVQGGKLTFTVPALGGRVWID